MSNYPPQGQPPPPYYPPPKKRSGLKLFLIIAGSIIVAGLLLIGGCVALIGSTADEVSKEMDESSNSGSVSSDDGSGDAEDGQRYAFSKLNVRKSDDMLEMFEGTIRVTNNTDERAEVYVTVNAYDGDENVGELNGSATLKPDSSSTVELTSLDDWTETTDYEVEVDGF